MNKVIDILMIEDDFEFAKLLGSFLEKHNIKLKNYTDPFIGLSVPLEKFDLVILDLTLPGLDGLQMCKEIRKKSAVPIIISSARSDIEDKIKGLNLGADDYLPKPYDPKELVARIYSVLRRYKKIEEKNEPLLLDEKNSTIYLNSKALSLTPAEFEVLKILIKNYGNSVSKEQILYSSTVFANSSSNSLAVIINRVRKKISSIGSIKTVRGVGYRLVYHENS